MDILLVVELEQGATISKCVLAPSLSTFPNVPVWYSSNPSKPTTQDGMRDIIKQERRIEMSFEGQRYWDLRRWKDAGDYFSRPVRGWNIVAPDVTGFYQVKNIFFRNYIWTI